MGNLADFLNVSGGTLLDDETPGGLKPLSFKTEDSAIRLRRAAVAAKEMDAKRAAEAAAYAEQNRVDPQAAYAAITYAPQDHSLVKMLNDPKWQEVAKKTPKLAEFLSDPINHKIAENDIENLSGLEYTWARIKQFGESLPEGVGQQLAQRRQSNALFTFMMHTAEPDLFHVTKSDLKELEQANLVNSSYDLSAATYRRNATSRAGMATANAVTQMGGTIGYGLAGAAGGGAAGALVGGSRGGVPGAVSGAGVGVRIGQNAGVFYDSFKMNAAGDFKEFASLKDEAGQPINQRVAAYAAITSGLVNAAIDTYVTDKVVGAIAPGVADKLRKLGGGGKVVSELLKRPGFRAELLRYGKDVAKLSALEVGTEGVQRAISLVMRELAKADSERNLGSAGFKSPSLFEPLTDDQGRTIEPSYASQIGTEMKEAAWGMPGAIAVFRAPHTVTSIRRQQNITASQEELKALDEVNTLTGESETRKASPEAFNRLMNLLGGKNASDAVHIDADAVTRLFQNEGINPAQGVRETFGESLVQPYEEALALGQSFRVPTQQFATEIAGTEMYSKLRESGGIRIRPEGLTEADLKLIDFNSEAETSKLEQLAADIASGKVTETPVQQVYKDIQAQLKGLNRYDQATINAYASQQAAFFGTLAGRMKREGVTAQSLYEPYRLRIVNEMPRIIQRVDRARFDERLDPLLEGVRAGKVPTDKEVRGPSLVDFILEKGGLVDSGGDLAGMDANAGRVGKNAIVRKTGRTLGAMAEVAHESGYLKSRDIQELLDGIASELRGNPVHSPTNEDADLMAKRQQMLDLQEALGGLGLDIGQYSNAELRDLLFRAGQESGGEAGRLEQPVTAGHEWEMGQRLGLFSLKPIEAVRLTGTELGKSDEEIKTAAMAEMYRIRKLSNTPLSNEDTGWSLSVSKEGASKIAKNRDQSLAGLQSVAGISDLVRRAVRAESHPDYKRSNPDLQAIHRLYAPVEIGGRLYRAKLTVRDYAGKASGNKTTLHALESIEIENAPLGTSPAPLLQSVTGDESAQPTTARMVSISDLLDGATDADGKPFSSTGGGKLYQSEGKPTGAEITEAQRQLEEQLAIADRMIAERGGLFAPNGEPSNLNRYQWAQVRTANFKRWFGDWEAAGNMAFLRGTPIESMKGGEVPVFDHLTQLTEWVGNYWEGLGGKETHPILGDIKLDERAAKDSIGHSSRMYWPKGQAFYLIPQIIRKGRLMGELPHDGDSRKPRAFVIAAPVQIGEEVFHVLVEVRKDANSQRMYLHEAIVRKEKPQPGSSAAGQSKTGEPHGPKTVGAIRILMNGLAAVNPDTVSKFIDPTTGEPLVVYHGTGGDFDAFDRSKGGEASGNSAGKKGHYFSGSTAIASDYALRAKGDANVMPAFLALPKPTNRRFRDIDQLDYWASVNDFGGGLMAETGDGQRVFMVKDPNQIKSATGNAGTFSAATDNILYQQARGHLSWSAARDFTLTLTGKANFSTFLHESAHLYLEVYRDLVKQGDLPQQMQDDWQAITRYLAGYADKAIPEIRATLESLRQQQAKATEPADLRRLSAGIAAHEQALQLVEASGNEAFFMQQVAINFGDNVQDEAVRAVLVTPFHEAWARSMEGYFLEGKAPNLELMGAFSRFKVWMKQIYGTLTGLNVKLTDEVREVMGRMFAMDDEIAEAKEMQNAKPLFASLAAAGVTKAQYDAYLKVVALADDQIEAEALAMMGSAEKQRLRQVAAKRDEVHNEVENELNRQKVQMLIHFLRTGNFRDGHDMGAYIHPMKLDRQTIIDRKGPEFLKALPKGMYRDASQATESERQWIVDPDGMAMLFGYSSGDEMLIELANERVTSETKRRDAIEAETDARLRQYFPDVTTSGESADIAMKAVNHATRADVLAREAELLADKIGEKATPDKIIQAYAVQKIAETPVFELQTGVYLRAVSKAANAAFIALGKGDYKAALLEKQRERVNLHLYREAMRAQEATSRATDYLGSFDKKNKRQTIGKAGGTEYALIAGQDVTFYPTQQEADAAKAEAGNPRAYVEQRSRFLDQIDNLRDLHEIGEHYTKGDLRAMESMELFIKQMQEEGGEAPLVESWMFRNIPWQRLSFGQYVALSSAIKSIEVQARNRHKLSQMQKGIAMEQITGDITDAIMATGDTHHQSESFNRTNLDIAGEALDSVVAVHAKAEFIMELLDGGPNGPMYRHFMKPAQAAEVLENDRIAEMRQAVAKIFSAYTLKESAKLGSHWGLTQEYVPELGESMSRESLLALALNWGNKYNRKSVIKGQANKNQLWTAENVEKALNEHLTAKDWDVVEQVWTLVNSYWPEVKALEERVSGVAPEKVEASPFQLKSGRVMAGGYYPLFYVSWHAKQAMQDAKTMLSGGMIESGLGSRAMTRHGHTIERTKSDGKPVMLTLDGLDRHLTSVIHDLVYRELLGDWNRILNNAQVRDAIVGAQGVAMYKQLQLWMRRIANDRQPMDTFVHAIFNRLNTGSSIVLLGFSLSNALQQQSGYLLAVPTLGIRSVAQGFLRLWSNPFAIPRTMRFVQERSGFMRQRDITFSREVRDAMKDLNPADKATNTIRRVAFYLTAKSQMTVDMATWMGAYEKALRGDAGPNVARGNEADAIDYADAVVRKTQSGGSAKDLATIQGQNAMVKAVTPLYGYFSVLFNQFLLAKRQTQRDFREGEYRRGAERIISNVIFLWLAPMLLSELLAARGPDDDEEWKDWLKKKGADIAAYPFASVIILNWFAANRAHPERKIGELPAFGGLNAIAQAVGSAIDAAKQPFKDEDLLDHHDAEDVALATGYAFALPTKGVYNATETFVMWMNDEYQPQSLQETMRSIMRGVPKEAYADE